MPLQQRVPTGIDFCKPLSFCDKVVHAEILLENLLRRAPYKLANRVGDAIKLSLELRARRITMHPSHGAFLC